MHTSLLFTTSLVLAFASTATAQDASCQASADKSGTCQKASVVSVVSAKAKTVAAPVIVSDDAPACSAEKATPVALDTASLDTLDDDEIAKLLKEVKAALAEVQEAAREATEIDTAAIPVALAGLGYVATTDERGYMGVSLEIGEGSMTVQEVMEGGGAAKAGLRAGDRILTIDEKSAEDTEALMAHLGHLQAGATVKVVYERDGKKRKAKIELSTMAAIQPAGEGEQRKLEKVEASDNVIEWIEFGEDDDVLVEEIVEVESDHEHEARTFTLKGGNQKVHVIGSDDLDLEALENIVVDLQGLEGLKALEGMQLKFEGLEALKGLEGLEGHLKGIEGLHLDLEALENLEGLGGDIRIIINGQDIDLSELENLNLDGIIDLDIDVDDLHFGEHEIDVDDLHFGEHEIEVHEVHGDSNNIRQRVIRRLGGQDGRHVVRFGEQAPVTIELQADPGAKTELKFGGSIAVIGADGEHQVIEIEGLPGGDFMKNFKLPKGIHMKGGNVIHLGHDDGDDDDDSPSVGFFFSDDSSDDDHSAEHFFSVDGEQRGQVIIKTQRDGGETEIQEFTFGGEDGEMPTKIRELLKRHGGMGQGLFVHEGGDHDVHVEIEEFMGGKGGNLRLHMGHEGDDGNVLFFGGDDHELPEGARNIVRNRVRFTPGGGGGAWVMRADGDDDSHGNVLFFGGDDHELPEGVREVMKNRVRFGTQGGNWAFTVDDDDDDHEHAGHDDDDDHEHAGHDDDDDHEHADHDDDHEVRVFEVEGGNWVGEVQRRAVGRNLTRRTRQPVRMRTNRMQLREVHEDGGDNNVRSLEREIDSLKGRIRELERAIERLGNRRR